MPINMYILGFPHKNGMGSLTGFGMFWTWGLIKRSDEPGMTFGGWLFNRFRLTLAERKAGRKTTFWLCPIAVFLHIPKYISRAGDM